MTLVLACQPGCVHRRMTIRSNPPGAVVYVDDYEIGTTPVSADFTYYGTRKIRLVKDGCETLTVMQPIRTPWYEITPLDFVFENLVPGEINDHRVLDYQLTPQMIVPTDLLLDRAEGLRAQAHANLAAVPPPSVSGGSALPGAAGPAPYAAPPAAGQAVSPDSPPAYPPAFPPAGGYPVHPLPR
jgi:hypothetical protein